MSEKNRINNEFSLPSLQLFYLFFVSLVSIVPMIQVKSVVGAATFIGIVVFYFLTEFKNLVRGDKLAKKSLYIDCILMFCVGALSAFVSSIFYIVAIFLAFRAYRYVAPKNK